MSNEILRLKPSEVAKLFAAGKMEMVAVRPPEKRMDLSSNIEQARKIFGQDFLGPEAIEYTFGVRVPSYKIPDVPFSQEELQRAKELGQFLVLRTNKAPENQPLTMQKIQQLLRERFNREEKGEVLFTLRNWHEKENIFTGDLPKPGWALVSKDVIPGSTGKTYIDQTRVLSDYLQNSVFRGMPWVSSQYKSALEQLNSRRGDSNDPLSFTQLELNRLIRRDPVEVTYDLLVYFLQNNKRLLENRLTLTNSQPNYRRLVAVGSFNEDGISLGRVSADISNETIGACFSRRF